jgi:hypothetical protein
LKIPGGIFPYSLSIKVILVLQQQGILWLESNFKTKEASTPHQSKLHLLHSLVQIFMLEKNKKKNLLTIWKISLAQSFEENQHLKKKTQSMPSSILNG